MRALPFLALACALAACAQRPPAPSPASEPFEIVRQREERKLAAGVRVVLIDNPYGEIQVRPTEAAAIAYAAVEQRIGARPRSARLSWFQEGERQGLKVRYPGLDPKHSADPRRGRVDLVVFVPAGPRLELRGGFGDIVVRRVDNAVAARTGSGRITVAARGAIEARSRSGAVRIFPMEVRAGARYRAETGGELYAEVPIDAPLALRIEAREALFADFDFDRRLRDGRGERAERRLGAATVPFVLRARKVGLRAVQSAVPWRASCRAAATQRDHPR